MIFQTPLTGDSLFDAILLQLETPDEYSVMRLRKQVVFYMLQNQNILHGFLSDSLEQRKDNMESYLTNLYTGKEKVPFLRFLFFQLILYSLVSKMIVIL